METIAVKHLSFRYPATDRDILRDVSFSVKSGEFVTLCGLSGSGKSTLLRHLKPALTPHGSRSGEILYNGRALSSLSQREQSTLFGFVQQSPDNQIVTDKVWHELSFGLENLGLPQEVIRRRIAETASFFGLQGLIDADVAALSGGQKQLLNLAAVTAMQPKLLLLDEPTSQLDPIAAADFLSCLLRINRELGATVIITEHRLDEVLPVSDRVLVLENGAILSDDTPRRTGQNLKKAQSGCFFSMPAPMRIWDAVGQTEEPCPVTVAQGRGWLERFVAHHPLHPLPPETIPAAGKELVTLKNVWFRYEKNSPDVLKNLSLSVRRGEWLTIMGGNGTGKTTLLRLLNQTLQPYSGKVIANGELCLTLPQNPQALFTGKTVGETLNEALENSSFTEEERRQALSAAVSRCRIASLLGRHPFDLSGGEAQKVALAKLLLLRPKLLLLDEPTKGLDAQYKSTLANILSELTRGGTAVVVISHDMEFCARYSHRCLLLFNGELVAGGTPRAFFGANSFYVTAAARMAKDILPGAVTAEDVMACCTGQSAPAPSDLSEEEPPPDLPKPPQPNKASLLKRIAGVTGALLLLCGVIVNLSGRAQHFPLAVKASLIVVPVVLLMAVFCARGKKTAAPLPEKHPLSKRTIAAAVMILLLIPLTVWLGVTVLQNQKYLFVSLLVMLEAMVPFFLIFEGRRPQARELVLVAVLCALSVAGRSAFAALPQIKPVLAMVIISGAALGGETGFIVGAVTMLVSNIYFGQGSWTPWQMFAAGLVGFLAGVLFRRGVLAANRGMLCLFGLMTAVLIYGGVMNFSSFVLSQAEMNLPTLTAFYVQGLPFDLILAFSTAAFLFFFAEPMLEKLDRIKTKYGIL